MSERRNNEYNHLVNQMTRLMIVSILSDLDTDLDDESMVIGETIDRSETSNSGDRSETNETSNSGDRSETNETSNSGDPNETTDFYSYSNVSSGDNVAHPILNLLVSGLDSIFTSTRQRFLEELEYERMIRQVSELSLREYQEREYEVNRHDVDLPYTLYGSIEDKNEDTCVICLEGFEAKSHVCLLNCKHVFHKECIKRWVDMKNTCPTCRVTI